jgi:hypothetical protein
LKLGESLGSTKIWSMLIRNEANKLEQSSSPYVA